MISSIRRIHHPSGAAPPGTPDRARFCKELLTLKLTHYSLLRQGWQRTERCGLIVIMAKTVKGRVGWAVVKKLLKAIPFVGTLFTVGFAGHDIKKKGLVPGAVHVGLDVIPVVGTAKNVLEIVTGDWIPDKPPKPAADGTPQLQHPKSGGKPTFPTTS